jgi:hypothetical protein
VLAGLALAEADEPRRSPARRRFVVALGVVVLALAAAYAAIEWIADPRVILFQPFRMATVARGLALVLLAGRLKALWERGDGPGQARVVLLVVGLAGDWSLVIATQVELAATFGRRLGGARWESVSSLAALGWGLVYLSRHDTESGHIRLLLALGGLTLGRLVVRLSRLDLTALDWHPRRLSRLLTLAWAVPLAALVVPVLPWAETERGRPVAEWLLSRCRFVARPRDDIERLAVWCRANTPPDALFLGPPGPKTFRLWSRRSLAFNRAGSPYHAAGLADWAERFRRHVAYDGSSDDFARAYLTDRQALERRFDALTPEALVELARSQGATHVIALDRPDSGPLVKRHVQGRYALYELTQNAVLARGPRDDGPH